MEDEPPVLLSLSYLPIFAVVLILGFIFMLIWRYEGRERARNMRRKTGTKIPDDNEKEKETGYNINENSNVKDEGTSDNASKEQVKFYCADDDETLEHETTIEEYGSQHNATSVIRQRSIPKPPSYSESQRHYKEKLEREGSDHFYKSQVTEEHKKVFSESTAFSGTEPESQKNEAGPDSGRRDDRDRRTFTSKKDDELDDDTRMHLNGNGFVELHDKEEDSCDEASNICSLTVRPKDTPIVKEFVCESPSEPFTFEVTRKGCNILSPYCKLYFPPRATRRSLYIRMEPVYHYNDGSQDRVFICPLVKFTSASNDELEFEKDVIVSLYSSYTAADLNTKVPVQVFWKKNRSSPLQKHGDVQIGTEKFISFTCRHFCGYTIAADQSQHANLKRHYFFAGYLRKPKRRVARILHWMIYEDCPLTRTENVKYLENKDVVIDPESFSVRSDFNLQLHITENGINVDRNNQKSPLVQKWGSKVNETYQFKIETHQDRCHDEVDVEYKIIALHIRSQAFLDIVDKHFYLEWSDEGQNNVAAPSVINVYDRGTGIRNDVSYNQDQQQFQHQTSVASNISDASSGYGSVSTPPTPMSTGPHGRSFSREDSALVMEQSQLEEDEQNEQQVELEELGATSPKVTPPRSPPVDQSTPLRPVAVPENDSEFDPLSSSERTFND